MYYSNGNYEAFAKPKKPAGVDKKSAYLVGSGLASLAAAAFLVRDGQIKGVVVVKWKIILNVFGIFLDLYHH